MKSTLLAGIHPVMEALLAGRPMERVLIVRGGKNPRLQPVIDECRKLRVPVRFEARESLDRLARGAAHQGVVALAAEKGYANLEAILGQLDHPGLIVALDGVEDPHNLGAIARTAHAAGADAVLLPQRRSAGLTETVSKASAGALEHLPIVRTANLNRELEGLKQKGFWIFGLDERGDKNYDEVEYDGNVALVLGSEGTGIHQLTAKHCDVLVKIPVVGRIASLNVSVAAGIALFEVLRQRRKA